MSSSTLSIRLKGITASPGIAVGKAFVLDRGRVEGKRYHLEPEETAGETRRFARALRASKNQLAALLRRLEAMGAGAEHTGILEVHLVMLQDPELEMGIRRRIEARRINSEWAVKDVLEEMMASFSQIDDEYFRERRTDVDQVGERLLRNLTGEREPALGSIPARRIVVSHELSPSDTVHMLRGSVTAFVTEVGTRTSHIAIVARSMQVPAMVGVEGVLSHVATDDMIIVDGEAGELIIHPSDELVVEYRAKRRRLMRHQQRLFENRGLPAVTRDGTLVRLFSNLEKLDEVEAAKEAGAEGVGLYRTEYLFMDRRHLPDEEEQLEAYRTLIDQFAPLPVVIRTLDVGADKCLLGEAPLRDKSLNPALGVRGVRYTLRHPELFDQQLRAILRASAFGPTRIMIPMVSSLEEVRAVKEALNRVRAQLEADRYLIAPHLPVGVMIETPAAALSADLLAPEVDFFSIGTNDLIHYTLAIDRMDERIAYLYQPLHPALLRLFKHVIDAGSRAGIEVSMCGEVAGEPLYAPLLLGLGLRTFSMSPLTIPRVKDVIRRTSLERAQMMADFALEQKTGSQIHEWLVLQYRSLCAEGT